MTPKTFDDFKKLATDESLKPHEKVDFSNRYTSKQIDNILDDWFDKIPELSNSNNIILDLGCGCQLVTPLRQNTVYSNNRNKLLLVDSQEMLDNIKDFPRVEKFPGKFPKVPEIFKKYKNKVDVIICYSVLQYVYAESGTHSLFEFTDAALSLLKPGGKMLLGDLPNQSKARRFFKTKTGIKFHQKQNKNTSRPKVPFCEDVMCDLVFSDISIRYRDFGHEVYLLPQSESLLFKNTREDMLIVKAPL